MQVNIFNLIAVALLNELFLKDKQQALIKLDRFELP